MEHLPPLQPLLNSQPDPHHISTTTNNDIPNHHQTLPHYDPCHHPPAPNPNPSTDALRPPGADHYTTHTGYSAGPYPYGYVAATAVPVEGHGYATKDAIRADPVTYSATVAATYPTGLWGLNPQANSLPGVGLQGTGFRNMKKKVLKVVQSVRCDVCNINLNSQEVLNNHKLGRKHKRNLEKLRESIMPQQLQHPKTVVPNSETEAGSSIIQGKKKSVSRSGTDLETKKRKVLEGGAAQDAVKVCTLCNVVCNSDTVFNFHLSGQKHATAVKKLAASES